MFRKHEQIYYSPSDLTRYMESSFASWMDRYSLECPYHIEEKDPTDELMEALQKKGFAHENAMFNEKGLSIVRIDGASTEKKIQTTICAIKMGKEIIAQAQLRHKCFLGAADFLVKIPGKSLLGDYYYEVWDTKLASKVKPKFVIQLCCYTEMLEFVQGVRPKFLTVALGNGKIHRLRTDDFFHAYCTLKKSFLKEQGEFSVKFQPDPTDSKKWGDWSNYANKLMIKSDSLSQVATITKKQINKLNASNIFTMKQLSASNFKEVAGINSGLFSRLTAQAKAQIETKKKKENCLNSKPYFKILVPQQADKLGLAMLPNHSPFDVFFDIEGDPLDDGGLEYLWGCTYFNGDGKRSFKDFWAHNKEEEKKAFELFIEWVYVRWQKDPTMHIYHYAHYEITACRKLMGRYGVCEYEVDQLLRNEVFIDLYKIVKSGLLLGDCKYSIKNIEQLYRGKRKTEIGAGGDSVAIYEQWRELYYQNKQGNTWQTSKKLKAIRDYNIDDCNSTQELVDWLRKHQKIHGIQFIGKTEVTEPELKEEITERTQLRDRLLKRSLLELESNLLELAFLTMNLAWILEFHHREAKPVFWRLYNRLGLSNSELMEDLDCLACCRRTDRQPFKPTSRAKNFAFEYRFYSEQKFKGTYKQFFLLGVEGKNGENVKVTFLREKSDLENGFIVLQSKQEPPMFISLIPYEYVNPDPIPQAIYKSVSEYESGQLVSNYSAITDFLKRAEPRIKGHKTGSAIAPNPDPSKRLREIIKVVHNLDSSYLTIQGPPGTGKSYTAKHIITELVKLGACIGIASNSHKAINNLLLITAKHCKKKGINSTFVCTKNNDPELDNYNILSSKNNKIARYVRPSCVLGATVWGFAREDMERQLDYLFIDEAGQVPMANLVAMSRSAKNLILMGDQMQLAQPSQSVHPGKSGLSILEYLLDDFSTIPNNMGVFLGITYRMHSEINSFISKHIYEGKLESHLDNDKRIIKVPDGYKGAIKKESGIIFIPVIHEGNTQASDEEVNVIAKLVKELIGRTFFTGLEESPVKSTRPIDWKDILIIAPYNHQVNKLKKRLGDKAKVGSVDKFQGQEAPIVFLSMCTSNASDSPRGLSFILNEHRINVAISRAQTLVIVVANPNLVSTPASTVHELKLVNLFNALVHG